MQANAIHVGTLVKPEVNYLASMTIAVVYLDSIVDAGYYSRYLAALDIYSKVN